LPVADGGNGAGMTTLQVLPRPTPEERHDVPVEVDVEERLSDFAVALEDWTTPRQNWDLTLVEGHDFGRANNVEARILYVQGEQTSALTFRLEQLDDVTDTGEELVLRFEEQDGIAKLARLEPNGLHVELFHILTFT
jgi:hypothetical protein